MSNHEERRIVRLLILDPTGRELVVDPTGQLPEMTVGLDGDETTLPAVQRHVLPAFGLCGPIVECYLDQLGASENPDEPVAALVEPSSPSPGWALPDTLRWAAVADVSPTVESGLTDHLADLLAEHNGQRPIPALRAPWSRAGWYDEACAWIEHSLDAGGQSAPASIEQFRHWGISALMRVECPDSRYWFKAVFPHFAHEAAITQFLDRAMPGTVAPVVAIDVPNRWLLLEDVGPESLSTNPVAHRPSIERLVGMQRAFVTRTDELVGAGCPRRPLAMLPAALGAALADPVVRAVLDLEPVRVDQLLAWLTDAVATIDAFGVPDTLVHGDFHPGNISILDGAPVLIDWSDAAVSHPLVDFVTWASWLRDEPRQVDDLWAMFVDTWAHDFAVLGFDELRSTFVAVAGAYQTVSYAGILAALEPTRRVEHADGLIHFFALLDAAVPAEPVVI